HWQVGTQEGIRLVHHAQSRILLVRVPELHTDHHLHAFLVANGANAEHRPDIYQTESADLHEVLDEVGAGADDHLLLFFRDDDDVVRDEAVPPFYQIERYFAFTDPRLPDQQHSNAVDVHKRTMNGLLKRKLIVQEITQQRHELG